MGEGRRAGRGPGHCGLRPGGVVEERSVDETVGDYVGRVGEGARTRRRKEASVRSRSVLGEGTISRRHGGRGRFGGPTDVLKRRREERTGKGRN